MKKITIKCRGAESLERQDLCDFQGELKVLTDENYAKLKQEVLDLGFSEPISVWKDKKGKHQILNGHQRIKAINKMCDEEGFICPPLPVSIVEADSLKQAKEKLLAFTSSYGTMTSEGLKSYMKSAGIKLATLDRFVFPEINLPEFRLSFQPVAEKKEGGSAKRVSFDAYQTASVKQIVLYYQSADYEEIIKVLDQLVEKWKLEDYSQVVWRLAREAVQTKSSGNR